MRNNKNILICATGAINILNLSSWVLFIKKNISNHIKVVLSEQASKFIKMKSISVDTYISGAEDIPLNFEKTLANWADILLVIPASANTIAKLSNGLFDNLLLKTIAESQCPVLLFPSMNEAMWDKSITQENINQLTNEGFKIIAEKGDLYKVATGQVEEGLIINLETVHKSIISNCL